MTTAKSAKKFRLPDPPEHPEDKMTNFDNLSVTGSVHHLIQHFGNPETTLVAGEHYLTRVHTRDLTGVRYPDLLIAFNVNPAAYRRSNAYVISEQGKPPDFVLEIASRRTGQVDVVDKRKDYAALGIPEYWRFDETGAFHRTRLAGDRLTEDGRYQPIPVEEVSDWVLQGCSQVLNLLLRWENGRLRWHDSATGRQIATFADERKARIRAQEEAREEREARIRAQEEAREEQEARIRAQGEAREEQEALIREREARLQAEARVRELEERLGSQGNQ